MRQFDQRTVDRGNGPEVCCGDEASRGHLCQYHEGYDDGYEAGVCEGATVSWMMNAQKEATNGE